MTPGKGKRAGKPKGTRKRAKGKRSTGTPKPKARSAKKGARRKRAPSLSQKMQELDRTVAKLGREKIKPGAHKIGTTRELTAGKKGQHAFAKLITAASKSKAIKTFSYELTIREGKTKVTRGRRVVPDLRGIRKKKGEGKAAFRARIEARIMRDVQKELFANVTGSDMRARERVITTKSGVRRRLKSYAEGKAVRFKIAIFAET